MDLLEQTALIEDLEIAANGHVGDAELAHEVGHTDRAVFAHTIEDECLALPGEHLSRTSPSDPTDCRRIHRKSTYSHKDPPTSITMS